MFFRDNALPMPKGSPSSGTGLLAEAIVWFVFKCVNGLRKTLSNSALGKLSP